MRTRNQVIKFVHGNARYFRHGYQLPNGAKGGHYAVEIGGCVYHNDDTGELVENVCGALGIKQEEPKP